MPDMDGFEAARILRQRERSRHTPIIFLTAIDKTMPVMARGYLVGAVDYILKPFDADVLRSKVMVFLDLAAARRQLEMEIVERQRAEREIVRLNTDLERRVEERTAVLLNAGALRSAIFNSANFSSIATDAKGVIQIFNVGAERMLGYTAADVMNKITLADISDPQEVIARAKALSVELGTPITPGFDALVFKASRGIEDICELSYIRKDGSRFPAVVSVTALRDAQDAIIGYLLIGTDNTARKEAALALRENVECFRTLANNISQLAWMADTQGAIFWHNQRWFNYTGTTLEEMSGWGWQKVHHPDHVQRVVEKKKRNCSGRFCVRI